MKATELAEAPVDLLLVTVIKVESLAVLSAIEQHTGQKARLQSRCKKTYHDFGTINGTRVWLVLSEMGAGGLGGAQQTVNKAVAELRPAAVVMVGIAFGVDEKSQAIGDILVSENLRLYELQRVGTDGGNTKIILRGDRPHGSPWLLDVFKNADMQWQGAKVRFGCVLTGEKLVDDLDFREQLRAFEPEAIGGEMEGAGLYTACQDAKVDWLLVKAICDWADGKKELDKKTRQELAARTAAQFVLHTLKTVPLLDRKPKTTDGRAEHNIVSQGGPGGLAIGQKNVAAGQGGVAICGSVHIHIGKQAGPVGAEAPPQTHSPPDTQTRITRLSTPQRDKVFISYSHRDERWLNELTTHLAPWMRLGVDDFWCDKNIVPGDQWRDAIKSAIQRAKVAVLLVSPYFLASRFIHDHELCPLLAAAKSEGTTILWIPVSNSSYEVTEINDYQAAIPPSRPLDCMSSPARRHEAFVGISKLIVNAVSSHPHPRIAQLTEAELQNKIADLQRQLAAMQNEV